MRVPLVPVLLAALAARGVAQTCTADNFKTERVTSDGTPCTDCGNCGGILLTEFEGESFFNGFKPGESCCAADGSGGCVATFEDEEGNEQVHVCVKEVSIIPTPSPTRQPTPTTPAPSSLTQAPTSSAATLLAPLASATALVALLRA